MVLDINVTSTCNLGCKYCSEGHNPEMPDKSIIENSKTDVKTQNIIDFIDRVFEKNPNEHIHIAFWGGEPMMNLNYCIDLMLFFKDKKNVEFFFYTNGTYIEKNLEKLKNIDSLLGENNGQRRMEIQISYDGKPINDIERLTKKGDITSDAVKNAYKIAKLNGLRVSLKSTISQKTFKYIYDSFIDIMSMGEETNYFPTPDSYSDYDEFTLEDDLNDLKIGLIKIAKYIYDNNLPADKFGWFRSTKALCQAGINYYGVNLDGTMSACHGLMYTDHQDHIITNINEPDALEKLADASLKYTKLLGNMNDDCVGCDTLFCLKCPAGTYELPSNQLHAEFKINQQNFNQPQNMYDMKWTTKNVNLCRVFKLSDVIYKPLLKALNQIPVISDKPSCKIK